MKANASALRESRELPSLTVAVPTFGRDQVLVDTLAQVIEASVGQSVEILVVDQTPKHEEATARALSGWVMGGLIRIVALHPPSLTAARNLALREAKGDVVLFLDDDVRVPAALFHEHARHYVDPSVAAVTGEVYNCLDWRSIPPLDDPAAGTRRHTGVDVEMDARNTSGGNHSVRRAVALRAGGYDPAFVGAALAEDLDFSQRLLMAGYRIRYNPAAWIIHLGYPRGGCSITGSRQWPEWSHSGSLLTYAFRHGVRQRNLGLYLWLALRHGPLRREVVRHPARWPSAWWGFARGLLYGWRHRKFGNLKPET